MFKFNSVQMSKRWLFIVATAGVFTAIAASGVFTRLHRESAKTINPAAMKMANEELGWAQQQSFDRLESQFAPVESLFDEANSKVFAESCLSWSSKWLLLKDKVNGSHEQAAFIANEFRSHVLDHDELERRLNQCTKSYIQEISGVDGEMLVRLQIDLASLPPGSVPAFDSSTVNTQFAAALQRAIAVSQSDVLATVQRETVGFVVSEVVTAALVQLGVSSGILATGAASGWATFGTGLLVGLVVDYAVQQYTDPAGELARDLDARMRKLKAAILQGDEKSPGIIPRLRKYGNGRASARRDAIHELLTGAGKR